MLNFQLTPFFEKSANFIEHALNEEGKLLNQYIYIVIADFRVTAGIPVFFSNNIHTFRISEPCILPVFCKVNQAVGFEPLKLLYIQLIHLFDCYIYTFIHIT